MLTTLAVVYGIVAIVIVYSTFYYEMTDHFYMNVIDAILGSLGALSLSLVVGLFWPISLVGFTYYKITN